MFQFLFQVTSALLTATFLHAAPAPLMSSELVLSKSNLLMKERGYTLDLENCDWKIQDTKFNQPLVSQTPAAESSGNSPVATTELIDEISLTSSLNQKLNIHIQNMKRATNIDSFAQRHTKEYAQFGFEILGNKKVTLGNKTLVLIDLYHRTQKKSVRQAIVGSSITTTSNRIAILSCEFLTKEQNSKDSAASIKNCNDVIQRFAFLEN